MARFPLLGLAKNLGVFKPQPAKSVRRVAVDLGQSHLIVIAAEKKGAKPEISHFRFEARPESPEAVSNQLREIFKQEGLEIKGVRTALKGQGMVIRHLTFPQMKKEDFSSAIQYEVEKYIPFKSSEIILDFQVLAENISRGNAKFMEVLLVAIKRSEVYQLLGVFQNAGLEVDLIDVAALSISNLLEFACPEGKEKPIGFLDMGAETCTFGILSHWKPLFIRDISFGGIDILKLLERKLGLSREDVLKIQANPSQAPAEYKPVVEQAFSSFISEFKLSLSYYLDHIPGAEPIQTLFMMGGGFRFIPNPEFLEKQIQIPTRRIDLLSHLEFRPKIDRALLKQNEDILPAAVGLCLR